MFRTVMTVLVSMTADHSPCSRFLRTPQALHMNDAATHITTTIFLITFIIHNRPNIRPIHFPAPIMLLSTSVRNFSVFFMEREVSCPTASCS